MAGSRKICDEGMTEFWLPLAAELTLLLSCARNDGFGSVNTECWTIYGGNVLKYGWIDCSKAGTCWSGGLRLSAPAVRLLPPADWIESACEKASCSV